MNDFSRELDFQFFIDFRKYLILQSQKMGGDSVNGEIIAGGDSFGCKWAASEPPAGVVLR